MQNLFIVIEGIDGSGTTTQATKLLDRMRKEGLTAISTAEPSKGPIGQFIRQNLSSYVFLPNTLTHLFHADRLEHLENTIWPNLQNKSVICDRYWFSTYAYQGVEVPKNEIKEMSKNLFIPDIVFFLDIEPKVSLNRVVSRGEPLSIFEKEGFLNHVVANYKEILREYQDLTTIRKIDATLTVEEIADQIWKTIKKECP